MLILLLLINVDKLALGIGAYPTGFATLRTYVTPKVALQLTAGNMSLEFPKMKSTMSASLSASFKIAGMEANYKPEDATSPIFKINYLVGAGAGIKNDSTMKVVGEAFGGIEYYPVSDIFPVSVILGVGLCGAQKLIFGPFVGVHFYVINLKLE
ncbi:MAG: hypothetical protein PHX21_08290 [bacterium]|nr:hypothetical protein [bacterium]